MNPYIVEEDDHFHDECAVFGVWGKEEAANLCYLGLYALQHRGQEGCGIVSFDGTGLRGYKDMGLVADVFSPETLTTLEGSAAIGHTRYATFGGKDWQNLQPLVANFTNDSFAVAHNGNLVNATSIRKSLEAKGAIFQSTSDTEVILHLIAKEVDTPSFAKKISRALSQVQGAYSLVLLRRGSLVAVRDPHGVRPLSLAAHGRGYVVASETCAFDLIGAKFIRDIEPGEIVEITPDGKLHSHRLEAPKDEAFCIFEYIYFARPDSVIAGRNVYEIRKQLGRELAKEQPAVADIVIPVPDSGVPAAIGYANELRLPMELGLIRNHYVGRTFIEPKQSIRDFGVKVKLNPNKEILEGKKVVVVDDSIVRGTTCRKLIQMIREAGAAEVHFRVSCPPTVGPCFYGIDTPSKDELIASNNELDQIRAFIGADSLGYLSSDGMYRAVHGSKSEFCDACFSGNYRLGTGDESLVSMPRAEAKEDRMGRRARSGHALAGAQNF